MRLAADVLAPALAAAAALFVTARFGGGRGAAVAGAGLAVLLAAAAGAPSAGLRGLAGAGLLGPGAVLWLSGLDLVLRALLAAALVRRTGRRLDRWLQLDSRAAGAGPGPAS
jgi:hypothetical protein